MLADGMQQHGHTVEVWTPQPKAYNLAIPKQLKKWLGYVDQYILFPAEVKKKLRNPYPSTLFVFTDHALGPWVPLVANRPHVIHCHDFLAQRSANSEIAENPTSYTGKKYQGYIKQGYQKGKNFISVSKKTQGDLHRFLGFKPELSRVVYNGLNTAFIPADVNRSRAIVGNEIKADLSNGYLLHIGGNQWYKNRVGVIDIYDSWRKNNNNQLPLIMVGAPANLKLMERSQSSPFTNDIYFMTGKSDEFVKDAYCGATAFLFPSLAEGFGWPIAEAMASGIPVITTGEAPMNEVGAKAAFYIPKRPLTAISTWADEAAVILNKVVTLDTESRNEVVKAGLENVKRFDLNIAIKEIEGIYQGISNSNT